MSVVAAFSGGKDSTAMATLMAEAGEDFSLLFTPTGNESDECLEHVRHTAERLSKPFTIRWSGHGLVSLIERQRALPNWRQRWCTRMLKIEPCQTYLAENPGTVLCVGLRADEPERSGLWGDLATYRYPLREAEMGLTEVVSFLEERKICVPSRTDCALCFFQRLIEWYELWRDHPNKYAEGERLEALTGHTFRSPQRDTWPTSMKGMRTWFEAGLIPKDTRQRTGMCRVCSL